MSDNKAFDIFTVTVPAGKKDTLSVNGNICHVISTTGDLLIRLGRSIRFRAQNSKTYQTSQETPFPFVEFVNPTGSDITITAEIGFGSLQTSDNSSVTAVISGTASMDLNNPAVITGAGGTTLDDLDASILALSTDLGDEADASQTDHTASDSVIAFLKGLHEREDDKDALTASTNLTANGQTATSVLSRPLTHHTISIDTALGGATSVDLIAWGSVDGTVWFPLESFNINATGQSSKNYTQALYQVRLELDVINGGGSPTVGARLLSTV